MLVQCYLLSVSDRSAEELNTKNITENVQGIGKITPEKSVMILRRF